jgi:hypothetical protein
LLIGSCSNPAQVHLGFMKNVASGHVFIPVLWFYDVSITDATWIIRVRVGGTKSTIGMRSQVRKKGKTGFNQYLMYKHPFSSTITPTSFICFTSIP